jgi:hypothetical protein
MTLETFSIFHSWRKMTLETFSIFFSWIKMTLETFSIFHSWRNMILETFNRFHSWRKMTLEIFSIFHIWRQMTLETFSIFHSWRKMTLEIFSIFQYCTSFTWRHWNHPAIIRPVSLVLQLLIIWMPLVYLFGCISVAEVLSYHNLFLKCKNNWKNIPLIYSLGIIA